MSLRPRYNRTNHTIEWIDEEEAVVSKYDPPADPPSREPSEAGIEDPQSARDFKDMLHEAAAIRAAHNTYWQFSHLPHLKRMEKAIEAYQRAAAESAPEDERERNNKTLWECYLSAVDRAEAGGRHAPCGSDACPRRAGYDCCLRRQSSGSLDYT